MHINNRHVYELCNMHTTDTAICIYVCIHEQKQTHEQIIIIIIIIIINFSQRRVPQKAIKPVQGGPQKQTDIHTYNYKK